ncbi:MAG: hypothetical protein AAF065_14620 [Verrucomicrobiota bacterium]
MNRIEPKYYATSLKVLSIGEFLRLSPGPISGFVSWIIGRFLPPQGKELMPTDYDKIESTLEDMSEMLSEKLVFASSCFEENEFAPIGWQRLPSDQQEIIDSGSVICLSSCGHFVGVFSTVIRESEDTPDGYIYTEASSISCYYPDETYICVADTNIQLDPIPSETSICLKGESVYSLKERIEKELSKRPEAIKLSNWNEVRKVMELHDTKAFLYRKDQRKLFVEIDK